MLIFVYHFLWVDSDDDFEPPPASYRAGMDRRRKSVFAESYEPGEDDGAVEKVGIRTQNWANLKVKHFMRQFL